MLDFIAFSLNVIYRDYRKYLGLRVKKRKTGKRRTWAYTGKNKRDCVYYNKLKDRWYGSFRFMGKPIYTGCFKDKEDARESVINKRKEVGAER